MLDADSERAIRARLCQRENAVPMLLWFPMVVMAGVYQAMSEDVSRWQRACIGGTENERDDR